MKTSHQIALSLCALALAAVTAQSADWTGWRGPQQNGTSTETGLIASWSPEGENLIWRQDFIGRSTPLVFEGRVCVNGRTGTKEDRQEVVACYDAYDGSKLWERRFNVWISTVPYNRASWASLALDTETGYLYHQGVGGLLVALDSTDGREVWSEFLTEKYGRFNGYGGRTSTPLVFEDLLIVNVVNTTWGRLGMPQNRVYAFDKKTGELTWISSPGGKEHDKNTYSNWVHANVGGRDLVIGGNADGAIYALEPRTGRKAWGFQLSKRGINSSVVVAGDTVFAGHSEENMTGGTMGRVVAIDATGSGDVTATHERWRHDELSVGHSSPAYKDGHLYVIDNSANLHKLDAKNGKVVWVTSVGTVGKASPVWADGKLYVTETNGHVSIVDAKSGELLSQHELKVPNGRYAETYGSPAIADGRIYFTTEEGLYCLGKPGQPKPSMRPRAASPRKMAAADAKPATLLVVPAEVFLAPGDKRSFRVEAFDDKGLPIASGPAVTWSLDGLAGKVADGELALSAEAPFQLGHVEVTAGKLSARARVRVISDLPWNEDFESYADGSHVPHWIGTSRYTVKEMDGNKVLAKLKAERGLLRTNLYMGSPDWSGYTMEIDVMGGQKGRRRSDVGVINGGYMIDLMGTHQRLQIRSWSSVLRMAQQVDFAWEPMVWYTMKSRVDIEGNTATVRTKVWPKGEPEPSAWTLEAADPHPVKSGGPGLVAYSPVPAYYDNLKITVNE